DRTCHTECSGGPVLAFSLPPLDGGSTVDSPLEVRKSMETATSAAATSPVTIARSSPARAGTESRRPVHLEPLPPAARSKQAPGTLQPSASTPRGAMPVPTSPAMRDVFLLMGRLAPTDVTVTLIGETGTGKDVFAHLTHDLSPRARQPFVVFDCGA